MERCRTKLNYNIRYVDSDECEQHSLLRYDEISDKYVAVCIHCGKISQLVNITTAAIRDE